MLVARSCRNNARSLSFMTASIREAVLILMRRSLPFLSCFYEAFAETRPCREGESIWIGLEVVKDSPCVDCKKVD